MNDKRNVGCAQGSNDALAVFAGLEDRRSHLFHQQRHWEGPSELLSEQRISEPEGQKFGIGPGPIDGGGNLGRQCRRET